MTQWIVACSTGDLEQEDVVGFIHEGQNLAIYCSPDGHYFCTDGLCTHRNVGLADGVVVGHTIECPKHHGRFDYRTGAPLCTPVRVPLRTYDVKVEGGHVYINGDQLTATRDQD